MSNQWPNKGKKGPEELCSGIVLYYQTAMMTYEQNSLSNLVHLTLQIFPCATRCCLITPANKDTQQEPDTLLLPSWGCPGTGAAVTGSPAVPAAPCRNGHNQELSSKTETHRSDLIRVLCLMPGHQLQLFARGTPKRKAPGCKVGNAGKGCASYLWRGILPAAPVNLACPAEAQSDGTPLQIPRQFWDQSFAYQTASLER